MFREKISCESIDKKLCKTRLKSHTDCDVHISHLYDKKLCQEEN